MPVSAAAVEARNTFTLERACGIVGCGQRVGAGDAAVDDGDRAVVEGLRQRLDEIVAAAEIGAVGQPHQIDVVHGGEELGNRRQRFRAIDRVRLRLHLVQANARRARGFERNVARAFRQRNERHGAAIVLGAGDDVVGGAHAGVPGGGSRPAVVDHDCDRAARGRRRKRRMPQRAGGGDDHQRGEREPHQGEPPRRAGGRFLFGRDFEQQPRRRKIDAARPRRDQAQQPPQHRQRQQADQHERFGKADGQSGDHAVTVA